MQTQIEHIQDSHFYNQTTCKT